MSFMREQWGKVACACSAMAFIVGGSGVAVLPSGTAQMAALLVAFGGVAGLTAMGARYISKIDEALDMASKVKIAPEI